MKKSFVILFALASMLSSCSQCYECTQEVEIKDGNGNVIGTSTSEPEDVCTADPNEISNREAKGENCVSS